MLACGSKQLGHHGGYKEVDAIQRGKQYGSRVIVKKLKDSGSFLFPVSDEVSFIKITCCCYSKWFPATDC